MASLMDLPTGIVLDDPHARALLYAAYHEGLVENPPPGADFTLEHVIRDRPSEQLLEESFEYLLLGGRIYLPFPLHPACSGVLLRDEIIVPNTDPPNREQVISNTVSMDILLAMLRRRGIAWNADQVVEKLAHYQDLFDRAQALGVEDAGIGHEFVAWAEARLPVEQRRYSPQQVQAWQELRVATHELSTVSSCIRDYDWAITTAVEHCAISGIPMAPEHSAADPYVVHDGPKQIQLVRFTIKELGRPALPTRLREVLAVTRSPEAEAFRAKIAEWTTDLRHECHPHHDQILRDLKSARTAMRTRASLERAGSISTVIGVLALQTPPPLGAVIGTAATVAGGVALAASHAVKLSQRWAMFGLG